MQITKEEFHQRLQRLAKTRPALLGKFQAAAAAKKEAAEAAAVTEDQPVEVEPVAEDTPASPVAAEAPVDDPFDNPLSPVQIHEQRCEDLSNIVPVRQHLTRVA